MRMRKLLGLVLCLCLLVVLFSLPAAANATSKDDVQQLVKSFEGALDSLEEHEFNFWALDLEYFNLKNGFTTTYTFNANETNTVVALGLDIAKLHIQIIDSNKKVIAEATGKNPSVEFSIPEDGDCEIVFKAEALEPGAKKSLSSYFGYLLEWK